MDGFHDMRTELRAQFCALVRSRASEERYIEFIHSAINRSNLSEIKTLDVILDLTLSVIDPFGDIDYSDSMNSSEQKQQYSQSVAVDLDDTNQSPELNSSYDADDEGLEDNFMFPCHVIFDDCHPELLCNYHREHLRVSRTSVQIIKHPKLCELVIEFLFKSLKNRIDTKSFIGKHPTSNMAATLNEMPSTRLSSVQEQESIISTNESSEKRNRSTNTEIDIETYINSIALIIKRLNKVCASEKKNCRILARTNILNSIIKNTLYLIQRLPCKQYIYLETLLRFAFTLADYRITGDDLKQLFILIKEDNADLNVILSNFEQLLCHHYRILKNIQPFKSINFPAASRTAEEIESNPYLSNSWHWRLRSKVIEIKKKRLRTLSEKQQLTEVKNQRKSIKKKVQDNVDNQDIISIPGTNAILLNSSKVTPSWLECSLITPLSNISPLIHSGGVKLCCSMWMSLCGDLLVTSEVNQNKNPNANFKTIDWMSLNGHWFKLTSRKRSTRLFRGMSIRRNSKSRRLSEKARKRQAHDKEDEERDELDEKIKKSEIEVNQIPRNGFNRLMNSSLGSMTIRANAKTSSSSNKKAADTDLKNVDNQIPPQEFLGRRARNNLQEDLLHIVSFAIDTLTIEIWLNVKRMTFCARACRVGKELICQVSFPSHLKGDGSWSHIVFCLEGTSGSRNSQYDKIMNLKVIVNGLHKEKEKLVYSSLKSPLTNFACLLGCERSTFGYVWKLSQVNIYKNIMPNDIPIYLLGKGPDFRTFTNFRQQSTLPLPDITQRYVKNLLNPRLLERFSEINEEKALNWLTQNIVIAFFAHQPDFFLDYSSTMIASSMINPLPVNHEFSNSAERFIQARVLNFSRSLRFNTNHGFGSALVEAGGIESVLVCYADVLRRNQTSSATTHSLALSILFKMSQTNQHHLTKFLDELNGLKLIEFILAHPDCAVSKQTLDCYLDFCFMKKDDHILIKSPKLVYHLLSCWKAWHKDFHVAKILYKRLLRLLQPHKSLHRNLTLDERKLEGCYIDYNFNMMTLAGSLDSLLEILRECLVPLDDCTPKINHELVKIIVNLISLLIKHPPRLDVILDITEFLFFLHPDPKAYVEASPDKSSFLYILSNGIDIDKSNYGMSGFYSRKTYSETSSSFRTSNDNINDNPSSDFIESVDNIRSCSRTTDKSFTSNEDVFEDYDDHMKRRKHHKIPLEPYQFIEQQEASAVTISRERFPWFNSTKVKKSCHLEFIQANNDPSFRKVELAQDQKCSNRNFAIANIADMLASIVKLSSTDPLKILSEALQKSIIDPCKLIILANNSSSLVREKVLRLFLYCIRACCSLKLRSVLSRYEQDCKGSSFKSYMPIQLMGRQLLKYPTTLKMIQLCYGIIVGTDDFETVDTICLRFEILNNNLQLNALILLIQLMTQLREPKEIVSVVRFVHAYIEQLMNLGEDDILSVLVRSNLVDCLMKIYFYYVEYRVSDSDTYEDHSQQHDKDNSVDEFDEVLKELDNTLIAIIRYFIQNLQTSETNKCIDDLLTYFDLINTYVPTDFQYILRDRQVKILINLFSYCRHYERCAREKNCGGKMESTLRRILPIRSIDELWKFPNYLSNSHLELDVTQYCNGFEKKNACEATDDGEKLYFRTRSESEIRVNVVSNNYVEGQYHKDDLGDGNFDSNLSDKRRYCDDNHKGNEITGKDVVNRIRATIEFAINLIITRESGVIPSPLERRFIIKCVKMLSNYMDDSSVSEKCQWYWICEKLKSPDSDCRTLLESFSLLVLYLLSPCDSMNLDERKYYAFELLKIFDANQLLNLLIDQADKTALKVLTLFLKDLIGHNNSQFNSEDSSCEQDDELIEYDTEDRLMILIKLIEYETGPKDCRKPNGLLDKNKQVRISTDNGIYLESKYCDIWMENLKLHKENARDKIARLKVDNQTIDNVASEDSNDSANRMLNEALQITRDVIIDKNKQRKAFFEDIKQNKIYNYHTRQQWLSLIIGHSHERAIWHLEDYYPKSWELNPVEGPSRIRRRLRAFKLILESRFFRQSKKIERNRSDMDDVDASVNELSRVDRRTSSVQRDLLANDWYSHYSPHPLCSVIINHEQTIDSNELRIRMFTTDKIHFNCVCSIIRPNEVCEGEVSIASWCIHFIGDRSDNYQQQFNNQLLSQVDRFNQQVSSPIGVVVDDSGYDGRINSITINDAQTGTSIITTDAMMQATKHNSPTSIVVEDLWFDEIVEIWDRRYQLQDVGLEIFLTNNMTYLLSFRNTRDKEEFKQSLMREEIVRKMINLQRHNLNTNLNRLTQLWRDGKLTNFDYLTSLNKLAGRSFNDLMQYPVFPFVLSNYTTTSLDLNQQINFRDLRKPMAVQNQEKEATFIKNYNDSQSNNLSVGLSGMKKPYHYGNHYSNSATVLHFLVRLPPFTQMLIQYQDNNFDQPDRTFHSMANTWQLITRDSNTDFKELIPEFFYLPEMFLNLEQFELGLKQSNELVDDVKLPPWCPNSDARLFTLIHRQALESTYVSENLHHWIDLIFGYKQTGKAAIEALNVFHPATYYGMIDLVGQTDPSNTLSLISSTIATLSTRSSTYGSDYLSNAELKTSYPSTTCFTAGEMNSSSRRTVKNFKREQADIERLAIETMIKTYGQMPRQLFVQPLKPRNMNPSGPMTLSVTQQQSNDRTDEAGTNQITTRLEPLRRIKGLRWGSYVGSPDESDVTAIKHRRVTPEDTSHKSRYDFKGQSLNRSKVKLSLSLLPNGDVAILKDNTSIMLDYLADRKSVGGGTYQPSSNSARSWRAGLSSVARDLNMIISRQQYSYAEPTQISTNLLESTSTSSSSIVSLTSSRARYSPDSLSLVSWFYLDGIIRIRHPALNIQKPNIPLVQAGSIVDSVTTCTSVPELNLLLVGYESGSICAHIVSTSHETVPVARYNNPPTSISAAADALASSSAAPSAIHFLHTTTTSASSSYAPLGPGKLTKNSHTGEPYNAVSLASQTLQSVRSINKTTRWLYCHSNRINCMRINVVNGIIVTSSDDGTLVIWDLNSLTYVRFIDYKMKTSNKRFSKAEDTRLQSQTFDRKHTTSDRSWQNYENQYSDYLCKCDEWNSTDRSIDNQLNYLKSRDNRRGCCICASGAGIIAISDTLGDIVSIKDINNRTAEATDPDDESDCYDVISTVSGSSNSESSPSSVLYCHSINGTLIGIVNCHSQVRAVCYSNAPEGLSVNVIVVGLADGLIRMYSSWDLSRVKEFHISGFNSPVTSLIYSRDNQLLYVMYEDGQLVVLKNKKKTSITLPKEWLL